MPTVRAECAVHGLLPDAADVGGQASAPSALHCRRGGSGSGMHQSIQSYTCSDRYVLSFARDGLVTIALMERLLDSEGIRATHSAHSSHEVELSRKGSLYVDHLNAVHLLLAAACEPVLPDPVLLISEVTLTNAVVFDHYFDDPLHRSVPHLCEFAWRPDTASVVITKDPALLCSPTTVSRSNCPQLPSKCFCVLDAVERQLSSCDTTRVRLLAMVARAIHAYQERSYDTCLVLLWTVVENLITKRYDEIVRQQPGLAPAASPVVSHGRRGRGRIKQQHGNERVPQQYQDIASQIRTLDEHDLPRPPCAREGQSISKHCAGQTGQKRLRAQRSAVPAESVRQGVRCAGGIRARRLGHRLTLDGVAANDRFRHAHAH